MAVYKVPQDVEADDKLIGPFSFRQFIYLIVVAVSGAGAWGLSQIFIPLAIIPLPFMVFFAALALPLRKDQPMETYLSAVVSFYFLKSRKRLWLPDGIDSFVTIIPPKDADKILTKNLNEYEATKRLGYLADLVDSHGWSVRGAGVPIPNTSISGDLYRESQQAVDVMDDDTSQAQTLDQKLQASDDAFRKNAVSQMQASAPPSNTPSLTNTAQANPLLATQAPIVTSLPSAAPDPVFNPMAAQTMPEPVARTTQSFLDKNQLDAIAYASALAEEAEDEHAHPVQPVQNAVESIKPAASTSATPTPDATMELAKKRAEELATRDDLSVQTLAEEANRMKKKDDEVLGNGDEVTISLR